MERDNGTGKRAVLIGVLGLLAVDGVVNLLLDHRVGPPLAHTLFEVASILVAMGAAAVLWLAWWNAARTLGDTRRSLELRLAERDAWRQKAQQALEGLGAAIDAQLRDWGLTPTEREIALLLLQGYSHKRIAELTGRRERTVRQHAVTVYQKSGLAGRAELAAFFLHDLRPPATGSDAAALPDRAG